MAMYNIQVAWAAVILIKEKSVPTFHYKWSVVVPQRCPRLFTNYILHLIKKYMAGAHKTQQCSGIKQSQGLISIWGLNPGRGTKSQHKSQEPGNQIINLKMNGRLLVTKEDKANWQGTEGKHILKTQEARETTRHRWRATVTTKGRKRIKGRKYIQTMQDYQSKTGNELTTHHLTASNPGTPQNKQYWFKAKKKSHCLNTSSENVTWIAIPTSSKIILIWSIVYWPFYIALQFPPSHQPEFYWLICKLTEGFARAGLTHSADGKFSGLAPSEAKLFGNISSEKKKKTGEHFKSQSGRERMRRSPEGKWQRTAVPLDGATLAVMQEYMNAPMNAHSQHHWAHTQRQPRWWWWCLYPRYLSQWIELLYITLKTFNLK